MHRGNDPSRFDVGSGETVTIRIIGVGAGQLETVAAPAERLMGDFGEGMSTATRPKARREIASTC